MNGSLHIKLWKSGRKTIGGMRTGTALLSRLPTSRRPCVRTSHVLSMTDPVTAGPTLVLAALLSFRLYERRPRGHLIPGLLAVRPSLVPGAGRGCFAAVDLDRDTVLGTYPGRLRPAYEYAAKLREVGPHVAEYCWKIGEIAAVDPTDASGVLLHDGVPLFESAPSALNTGLLANFAKATTLALVNEPGAGGDTNTRIEIEGEDVYFITERSVAAGDEILIDYGQDYDRSKYGSSA